MSELKIIFSILGVILLLLFGFLWYSASNQRDDLNSKLKNLQTRFNETADERDKMRSQLNAANSQADSLNQQLTAAKQKATRDKNELDNLNARINSLNRDTESTEAQIRNLGRDKAALLEELDALKSSPPPTDLTADVHTLLSERELLKNKLVEVRSYVLYTLSGVSLAPPDNLDNSDLAALSAIADPLAAPAETAAPGTVEAGTVVTGTVETGTTDAGTTDAGTTEAATTVESPPAATETPAAIPPAQTAETQTPASPVDQAAKEAEPPYRVAAPNPNPTDLSGRIPDPAPRVDDPPVRIVAPNAQTPETAERSAAPAFPSFDPGLPSPIPGPPAPPPTSVPAAPPAALNSAAPVETPGETPADGLSDSAGIDDPTPRPDAGTNAAAARSPGAGQVHLNTSPKVWTMTFPGVPEKKGTEIPLYSPAPTESDRLKAENELQPLPQSQSSALANAPTAPQAEPETRTTGGTEIIPSVPDGSKAAVRYREMAPFWT